MAIVSLDAGIGLRLGHSRDGEGLADSIHTAGLETALHGIGMLQVGKIKKAFYLGGHQDRGGSRWAPLSPRTIERKQAAGKEGILRWTGRLIGSIQYAYRTDGEFIHHITLFSDTPYAAHHQRGRGRLPARPILVATGQDIFAMRERLARYYEHAINHGEGGSDV